MQLLDVEKNIPHDEKNCKDTLQSTQTQLESGCCKVHRHRWGQEFRIFFAIYLPQMAFATCISQSDFETLFHTLFYFLIVLELPKNYKFSIENSIIPHTQLSY